MIHKNRKDSHHIIEKHISDSLIFIAQGELNKANDCLNQCLGLDFSYNQVMIGLNYLGFWMDRIKVINKISDSLETVNSILGNWKQFKKYIQFSTQASSKTNYDEKLFSSFKHLLFTKILTGTQEFSNEQEKLLWSGIAYKGLGNLQGAYECFVQSLQSDQANAHILSELADTCSLLGNEQKSRAFFREAFYINPQDVDIDNLESSYIRQLIIRIKEILNEDIKVIREWIPVYGTAFHEFHIKRELRVFEYGKLRQKIFKLEQKLNDGDTSYEIVPRLLNYYFWLIDYMVINQEEQLRIQEILLKIESLSPEIYEAYTEEKSRQSK